MFSELPDDVARAIIVKAIQLRNVDRFYQFVNDAVSPVFDAFDKGCVPKKNTFSIGGFKIKVTYAKTTRLEFQTIQCVHFSVQKGKKKEDYVLENLPSTLGYSLCHIGWSDPRFEKGILTALKNRYPDA